MTTLNVVGAGGHGRELASIALAIEEEWPNVLFWDDAQAPGLYSFGEVAGTTDQLQRLEDAQQFVVGIGDPATRRERARQLTQAGHKLATLVHPAASIGQRCRLGAGAVVGPASVVTCDSVIGELTHLHANVVVSHDCRIGSSVLITPGVSVAGDVTIGDMVWLGVGSTINRGLRIGEGALVGAGAVVIHDVEPHTVVAGVPARPLDPSIQR